MSMRKIKIKENHNSYKIGMDEVEGLDRAMAEALSPVFTEVKSKVYWSDNILRKAEYKSRDGFIPYSDNFGGLEIVAVIPKCEEYEFDFLDFGVCDDPECDHESECSYENEGYLDSKLRIWFKFEGVQDGTLKFYLVLAGGNGDAPYFRNKYESTIFETSFECKSVAGLKRASAKPMSDLLKILKGE